MLLVPASSLGQFYRESHAEQMKWEATCKYNCPTAYIEKWWDVYIQWCGVNKNIPTRPLRENWLNSFSFQWTTCEEVNIWKRIFTSWNLAITSQGIYKDSGKVSLRLTVRESLFENRIGNLVIRSIIILSSIFIWFRTWYTFFLSKEDSQDNWKRISLSILVWIIVSITIWFLFSLLWFVLTLILDPDPWYVWNPI